MTSVVEFQFVGLSRVGFSGHKSGVASEDYARLVPLSVELYSDKGLFL